MTLHENGVLHRDLKPGNLLVSKNCDVKITDFGLSRYIPHGGARTQANDPKADKAKELMTEYVVTRWYRPPEIMLSPNGTYNEAVDMWSIGCIFGELLNRRPVFPGTDFIDQLTRVFSVLPVPSSDKRGYVVEGDALKFLESLPPCSPSAITKTFRKASPEAVSLLRRLLCINPERRITAKQALAHPYFKSIRQQLGEPPEFQVGKAFDFEFDYEDFPLSHLKKLIQEEVKLLQQDQKNPEVNQAVRYGDTKASTDQQEIAANQEPVAKKDDASAKEMEKSPAQSDDLSENDDDFLGSQSATRPMPEKPKPAEFLTKPAPKAVVSTASAANASKQATIGASKTDTTAQRSKEREPETDEVDSDSESSKQRQRKSQQQPANDSEDEEQQEVIQVERSKRPVSGKLERPKSAGTTRRNTLSYRDARDEDEHRRSSLHTRSSSSSSSNNNNDVRASSNEKSSSDSRWGQPCVLQSSRLQQPVHSSTSHLSDRQPQKATISARTATTSSSTTTRSSNQAKDSGDKLDSTRHAERVSLSSNRTSPGSSRTTTTSKSSSSSAQSDSLPDGWVKKIHSKSGKEYYYDTNTKVSSWKHPAKLLENIFGTTCIPQTSQKHAHTSSSESLTPTSSTSSSSSSMASRRTIATTRGTASSKQPALPKDWARRIDPKTGRLFYLNLVTNKSFTKLPASVLASMAAASSKESTPTASATVRKTSEQQQPLKKKVTVPLSPQFSQMSWQRKKAHTADD